MSKLDCCYCHKPIQDNKRYFVLILRQKGTYGNELRLNFCSFKCLEHVINNPAVIITEIL